MAEVRRSPQAEIDLEMILGDLDQNDHASPNATPPRLMRRAR